MSPEESIDNELGPISLHQIQRVFHGQAPVPFAPPALPVIPALPVHVLPSDVNKCLAALWGVCRMLRPSLAVAHAEEFASQAENLHYTMDVVLTALTQSLVRRLSPAQDAESPPL